MAGMFGIIVAGRLVQTDIAAALETKFVTEIADADNINHIVVFMTGAMPFPDGLGGAVHFCWPETGWSLLGFITNDKPSAIFKISGLKTGTMSTDNPFSLHSTHAAQLGISVESITDLSQQTPAANTLPSSASTFSQFTEKLVQNFVNFASSFAVTQSAMTPMPSETFVPFKAIERWYTNIQQKMAQNPNWWKN